MPSLLCKLCPLSLMTSLRGQSIIHFSKEERKTQTDKEACPRSHRSVGLQGEGPAERELKLRMVGNSTLGQLPTQPGRPRAGRKQPPEARGTRQTRVPGNEPYPGPFLPARPVLLAGCWLPPIPSAPSKGTVTSLEPRGWPCTGDRSGRSCRPGGPCQA